MKLEDAKLDEELKWEIDEYMQKKKEEYEKGREEWDWIRKETKSKVEEKDHFDDEELYE